MRPITAQELDLRRESLLSFSDLSEEKIWRIWACRDTFVTDSTSAPDFKTLQHSYDAPLYVKMIFRFRQYERCPCRLASAIDPGNQQLLLYPYQLDKEIIEFFAWIKNGLGPIDIKDMGFPDEQSVVVWNLNGIKWFFTLQPFKQDELLNRYNRECVDAYNRQMEKLRNGEYL